MELKEWTGPREEGRRPRGAEDEDSAPGHSETLRTFPPQGFVATGLTCISRWSAGIKASSAQRPCHPSCRLLVVPSLVSCLEEDISPWGAQPAPQDSEGQPGTQRGTTLASPLDSPWWEGADRPRGPRVGVSCCLGPSGTPTHPGLLFAHFFFPHILPIFPPLWC